MCDRRRRIEIDGLVVAEPSERERGGAAYPSSCLIKNFRLAVAGEINSVQRSLLSADRANATAFAVLRPLRVENLHVAFALAPAADAPVPRSLPRRILRLGLSQVGLRLLLSVIDPVHVAGLDRNNRQSSAICSSPTLLRLGISSV